MTVAAATVAHADVLAAIHATAFPPKEAWSPTVISLHIEMPGGFGFIDERGGMILSRTIMDEAEILTLAVMPAARRIGVARGLMDAALQHAGAAGAQAMFLEVAEENDEARRLYDRIGFSVVGRRPRYYANGDDALVMRIALTAPGATAKR
jgi:[ribosomal protein S18]-alanine N-acetyltransferase